MIDSFLKDLLNKVKAKNKSVYIIIAIIFVFTVLASLVGLLDVLGFGAEIAKSRLEILLVLGIFSVIGVLIYVVIEDTREISSLNNQSKDRNKQLEQVEIEKKSLCNLMETYKQAAYTNILNHLNTLLIFAAKRKLWQDSQAKITKVRIKPFSGAEIIDINFARKERIDIIINIGQKAGVCDGMEFLVRDNQIPLNYGLISVSKVYPDAAICTLVEELSDAGDFWLKFYNLSKENGSTVVEVQENCIVPNLPAAFDSITPENAESLIVIISKISNQPVE